MVEALIGIHKELELAVAPSQPCGYHGDSMAIRTDKAIVVKARISQDGNVELKADQGAEGLLPAQYDVAHSWLLVVWVKVMPGYHLVGIFDKVGHESELFQKLLTKEDGDKAEKYAQDT